MGLESPWYFWSDGLQSHQAGLIRSCLIVQIPTFASALHNAGTYGSIPTWALAAGSLCEVASLSLLFPSKSDHTLEQTSYSAAVREEGGGMSKVKSICMFACLGFCTILISMFPF